MAKDTKESIPAADLEMFSQKGYAGTEIHELPESFGIVNLPCTVILKTKIRSETPGRPDELIANYMARFGSMKHLPPVPDSLKELDR